MLYRKSGDFTATKYLIHAPLIHLLIHNHYPFKNIVGSLYTFPWKKNNNKKKKFKKKGKAYTKTWTNAVQVLFLRLSGNQCHLLGRVMAWNFNCHVQFIFTNKSSEQ